MEIRLIRHATLIVTYNQKRILVDPMLSPREAMPPIANSTNDRRNPLVSLPVPLSELLHADAVVITHTHRDHFDDVAASMLPKNLPVFCQPEDEVTLESCEFENVLVVHQKRTWNGIEFTRTGGRHGTGEIGRKMAPVSGFVLDAPGEPRLYIAGDSIYCDEVHTALDVHRPEVVVVNAGAAQFATGDPITMTADDVMRVGKEAPNAKVVAVHMDSINHCLLTRTDLREQLERVGLMQQVLIPLDGETVRFSSTPGQ